MMSVDLNKKGKKVNLSKKSVLHQNKVTLAKTPVTSYKEDIAPKEKSARPYPIEKKKPVHMPEDSGIQKSQMPIIITGVLVVIIIVIAFVLSSKQFDKKEDNQTQGYKEEESQVKLATEELLPTEDGDAEAVKGIESDEFLPTEDEEAEADPITELDEAISQYFIPESDSRYLSMPELEGLTEAECRLARNELYARHGRRFNDEYLQAYFDSCEWYQGTIEPADFDESVFNEYEAANRDLIVQYEENMGYR